MKLKFVVGYRTNWGQQLCVEGSCKELGEWDNNKAVAMTPTSGELWELEIEISSESCEYNYIVKTEGQDHVIKEFGGARSLEVPKHFEIAHLKDNWRSQHAFENNLLTAPFMKAFFKRENRSYQKISYRKKESYIRLQLRAPRISESYQMGVLGSIDSLGNWDEKNVILMSDQDFPIWTVDLPIDEVDTPFEYKFVIYSHKEEKVVTWESGTNRYFPLYDLSNHKKLVIHSEEEFRYPVGHWKTAGVAIPVFSLRTESSAGVGEFPDIKLMVDWAVKTGMKVVQVLPVNDTVATHTWVDSYPYAAVSVDALHPIYANLGAIGKLKDIKAQKEVETRAKELNALAEVDYEQVMALKMSFFKQSFEDNKASFLKSKEFKSFFSANEHWLPDYAAFCCLRDRNKTPDFTQWGKYEQMTDKELAAFVAPKSKFYDEVAIHYYIQFHLDQQLKDATAYARANGVVLKGDIPIGIYRNSVDAWRLPHLFNMATQAGAPPDDFSITGQNWGFPTYNWEEMSKDDYSWWRERMVKMSDYFDVFRIDHILGFFRIWEIPWEQVEGLMGRFNPSLPFHLDELAERGLHFDYDRFCKPYIREHMIFDLFGNHAESIISTYLDEYSPGCYQMKEFYDTQRKVKEYFDSKIQEEPESADFNNWIRNNLYRLIGEVLFLEAPLSNGRAFNPRMSLHSTYSFNELDHGTREKIDQLYIDYYYRRHNEFWRESAMRKLPMLKDATDMLICGEDLGMVPASVPGVMNELQILSLAIQRMPNDDREFWNPADTPYLSVTSTGSHDMSTLREWWQEDEGQTQRFFNHILGHWGKAPDQCEPWVAKDVISQHLASPSMLAIFPIQDLVAMDGRLRREDPEVERINVPAISQHYWKYRFHLTMEDLLKEEGFNGFLRQMIDQGGRQADY
ncbi:4-alpha-glucanotransferase [Marinoscillum pacificum]|uniref:4-alpha-glucanotransferase n=1 Tax=Marinoscillum pacificum TaxID=392723 RepID=UPI00215829A4|nr:4-alpha-glucanotransferase [Marinoscillum pacificum]